MGAAEGMEGEGGKETRQYIEDAATGNFYRLNNPGELGGPHPFNHGGARLTLPIDNLRQGCTAARPQPGMPLLQLLKCQPLCLAL